MEYTLQLPVHYSPALGRRFCCDWWRYMGSLEWCNRHFSKERVLKPVYSVSNKGFRLWAALIFTQAINHPQSIRKLQFERTHRHEHTDGTKTLDYRIPYIWLQVNEGCRRLGPHESSLETSSGFLQVCEVGAIMYT